MLHFNPNSGEPMTIACLWSHWTHETKPELYSFAAIREENLREYFVDGCGGQSVPIEILFTPYADISAPTHLRVRDGYQKSIQAVYDLIGVYDGCRIAIQL